jgi:hypothetical protein
MTDTRLKFETEAGFSQWLAQFPSPKRFGFTRRDAMTCSEIHLCRQAYEAGVRRGVVIALNEEDAPA